jgi:hypothetical protein
MAKIRYDRFYYEPLPKFLTIGDSDIDGLGLFATEDIDEDEDLGTTHIKAPMIAGFIRTPLGGFINHSEEPNCVLILTQDWDDYRIYNLYTLQKIHMGEEITLNYDN